MLSIDDTHYDAAYFARCRALFESHPVLGRCEGVRFTACLGDPAFAIALCLYLKDRGGSLFPLAPDTPLEAARRRAERSGSAHLIFGPQGEAALETIEAIVPSTTPSTIPSLVQMSSGTTGEPKYIERSWASVDLEIESYVRHFELANAMTPIVACPVNHSYGLISGVLVALRRGLTPVVIRNLNPKYILRKVAETESPLLYASPTLLATLTMLADPERPIFAVMTSGVLLQKAWFDGLRTKVRHLHQQYGCSEAGCVTLGVDIQAANEIGVPLPHLSVIAGSDAGHPDEIVVSLADGRTIATRDLGYLEGGRLHFVSRVDDLINVSGLNVYPAEVEEVVLEIPEVTDAVVYRTQHGFGHDRVCLQFVATEPLTHQRVREWCARKLAGHQVPMLITQVDVIPRLPNGKVSRKALAEAAASPSPSREALS